MSGTSLRNASGRSGGRQRNGGDDENDEYNRRCESRFDGNL